MLVYENIMMRAHLGIIHEYLELAEEFRLGIEVGDFCDVNVLADQDEYDRRLNRLKEILPPLGLKRTMHGPFRHLIPHSTDQSLRNHSRKLIVQGLVTAQKLGCDRVVVHSAYDERNDGPEELKRMTDDFIPFLEELLDRFEPLIVLENIHDRDTAFLRGIADRLDHPRLGFCMDVGHMSAFGEIPSAAWYETFAGRIFHNHWHDNRGDRDAHGPLGSGTIDWQEIAALRRKYAPNSTVALEIPSGEGIRQSLATLEKLAEDSPRSLSSRLSKG
ncbi:MAG: sugar phosphate isomerase/epimerase [Spirochaetales bacterium]|nr:sugar phosphate isomerase/epimerase [Spirochaetales bacterium]